MIRVILFVLLAAFMYSCKSDSDYSSSNTELKDAETNEQDSNANDKSSSNTINDKDADTILAPATFSNEGFDSALKYELLLETHICNPNYSDSVTDGSVPCSAKFFRFFEYNHKRTLNDAFMLQVKAGVNNYQYRRLLIFTRERGKLILVNGIRGYLVSQIKRPNEIDDLVVGVIDDLGSDTYERYDVLLRYKDGKYQVKEALGDLEGPFDSQELKNRATKMIKQRIEEKQLIF